MSRSWLILWFVDVVLFITSYLFALIYLIWTSDIVFKQSGSLQSPSTVELDRSNCMAFVFICFFLSFLCWSQMFDSANFSKLFKSAGVILVNGTKSKINRILSYSQSSFDFVLWTKCFILLHINFYSFVRKMTLIDKIARLGSFF